MRVGYWTYEVCPWRRVRQYHSENAAGGNAAVHSEFSLGTYAKGQDEWDAAKRLYSQRYTVGTEGRGTLVRFVCPESRREEDGIAIVHEPKPKQYLITMRVAALCHEARDDAAPAQQQRPAASARATRAAAEVPQAGVAPASMPAASAPQAARPPRRRQRGAATGRRGWRRSCYHRRDCCRRSVTAAFRPRRTTGRMNCARCVRSDSSGSRARASPPSFRSASMKSSKTSSPLACAASCRRGSCRTSSRSAPPSRPSLLRSLLRSFAPSPRSFPSPSPSPASRPRHSPSPFSAWPRAHLTLSPMSPHAQDVPERHQQPEGRRAGALRPQE